MKINKPVSKEKLLFRICYDRQEQEYCFFLEPKKNFRTKNKWIGMALMEN